MTKISVIVPIYNTQDYLKRCIESIINQTIKDIEIILVNDGSTDKSGDICDEYEEKYNNIKVIHKVNSGVAASRNEGMKIASGYYIGFVDSDDFINNQMYEVLYDLCIKYKADISTCLAEDIKQGKKKEQIMISNKISTFSNTEAIKNSEIEKLLGYSVCNKLYNKELFDNIKFPSNRIYEDASVLYKLYMISNKIVYIEYSLYKYMIRDGSITRSKFSDKRFDAVIMFQEKYDFMDKNYPEICEKIKKMYYISLRNIITDIVEEGSITENYKSIKKASYLIRRDIINILKNKLINKNHKLLAIAIAYFPHLSVRMYTNKMRNNS